MTDEPIRRLHLERIDEERNCWRWYALSVEPTLFGDWALVRAWGRIGNGGGQFRSAVFGTETDALAALEAAQAMKVKRGYAMVRPWSAPSQ